MKKLYFLWTKIKKLLMRILTALARDNKQRKKIRCWFFPDNVNYIPNDLPMKKCSQKINVSFCFDNQIAKYAAVTITSLLSVSKGKCDYDIFCVVGKDVTKENKNILKNVVKDTGSRLTFFDANDDFDKSGTDNGKWPTSIYYRLMLVKFVPNIDEIIYADIDVVFCNDLIEASRIDLANNLLAAVNEAKYSQINSGFLIMNLKQIRKEGLYEKWIAISKKENLVNPDQALLDETCRGRILFLPVKYNYHPGSMYLFAGTPRIFSKEFQELKYHAVVLHYVGGLKPWKDEKCRFLDSEIWWHYAEQIGGWNK
ncbi:MAG: glycosyltransferase family 8 protein [Rickettsiales bacterium]|jgi:lipopolysaccharide biosynthesis glycosyltransferase|nr:glycosyltransferase family 8 protein [Rickettsiales bacterium]